MIDSVKNATAHGYNSSNELTSADAASFTYDQNGNTLTENGTNGQTAYAWDFENRLTSVTLPNGGGTVTFKYDPFGRRIERSGPSGTTIYAYDGANGIEELSAGGAATARYVHGAGVDEPLAESSSSLNYFSADGLGSITSLEDSTGTPQATFVYGAFGVLSSSSGSATTSYRYTAREFDQDTGLYYYRARYYDSGIGRFISEDPARFSVSDDFYSYVANDPVMLIDPTGLQPCCSQEQDAISRRVDTIRQILSDLRTKGIITGVTKVGGDTYCVVNTVRLPNGQLMHFTSYVSSVQVSDSGPCVSECMEMHERVHQRQCRTFGPTFSKLSMPEAEIPAYTMELGCLLRQMMQGHFGPYGSH